MMISVGTTTNSYGGMRFSYYNGIYVSYESSNPNIVSIDSNGNITGASKGTAIITAKYIETPSYELGSCSWDIEVVGE